MVNPLKSFNAPAKKMNEMELNKSKGILDDHAERKTIVAKQARIGDLIFGVKNNITGKTVVYPVSDYAIYLGDASHRFDDAFIDLLDANVVETGIIRFGASMEIYANAEDASVDIYYTPDDGETKSGLFMGSSFISEFRNCDVMIRDGNLDMNNNGIANIGSVTAQYLAATVSLKIPSKSTTGDPTGVEGMIYTNTFDNAIKIYTDGAWRTLISW